MPCIFDSASQLLLVLKYSRAIIDYDASGNVVEIEILGISKVVPPETLRVSV